MQIKGMTPLEQKTVEEILEQYKQFADFFYYGSRVKGTFSELSDLDVLVDGELSSEQLREIRYALEDNNNLPFVVNLSIKQNMTDDFFKLIEKDLVKI